MMSRGHPGASGYRLGETMKRMVSIVMRVVVAAAAILLISGVYFLYLMHKDPNPSRPQAIDARNGYVQAHGTNLYDGNGKILQLKGVNLGGWFIQEFWMGINSVGQYDTGLYTQVRAAAAMKENPNLTEEQIRELDALYLDNYIREEDFRIISELGMNTVRIPFTCYNVTEDGYKLREDAFGKLDWAVDMCTKYGLYAVIDLHGAVGSQNMDIHSGDDAQYALYGNKKNEESTIALWKTIASHYRGNKTVAAYDLLNEPRRAPGKFGGKVNFDFFDRLYKAVREEDPDHLILIECFSFPVNGAKLSGYDWENICIEYHIYNLTEFSQKTCLNFYRALHNLMGYNKPVLVGEWNAFEKESEWKDSFEWFDEQGWSFMSWCYKANAYAYIDLYHNYSDWGLFDLRIVPVDLSTATFEEIAEIYGKIGTEHAEKTAVYGYWEKYLEKN